MALLDKHLGNVIQALMVAAMIWVATTLQKTQIELAGLTVQVGIMVTDVAALQSRTTDRYTSAEAARDFARYGLRIDKLVDRLRAVEMSRPN